MNNAAVIGRQIRQNNVNYRGSVYGPSHPPQANSRKNPKGLSVLRNKASFSCIWSSIKALSGGIFLFAGGMAMMVVGFFAEPLSTRFVELGNGTVISKKDADLKLHLTNLGYVGPVIMGIGGIAIVAAVVFAFDAKEPVGSKIVPITDDQLIGLDRLVKEKTREEKSLEEKQIASKQFWYGESKTTVSGSLMAPPDISPAVADHPQSNHHEIDGQKY